VIAARQDLILDSGGDLFARYLDAPYDGLRGGTEETTSGRMRLTNRVTNGEEVTVFGYGACGRGVAANFRGACARVTVVDVDPVTRLRAHLDGFSTPPRAQAIADADLIITVTGARDVPTARTCRHGGLARCRGLPRVRR
jgi:adenosylhomocysteinase